MRFIGLSLFCTLIFLQGCAYDGVQDFYDARHFDVGRKIEDIPLGEPAFIESHNGNFMVYVYEFYNEKENGFCKWKYKVDKITRLVESWKYISSSSFCSYGAVRLGTPW